MNCYFPHVPLILIAVLVWLARETLRTGTVEKYGIRIKRAEKPITFWAFVGTNMLWIAAMAFVLALWAIDLNGVRTG